ncbi:MAG: hypothetical protein AAF725_06685 [Acidobacteriota bacterium]
MTSAAATPNRLDVFRRGREYLCVARAAGRGSLKTLFLGEMADSASAAASDDAGAGLPERLGGLVLGWLEDASGLEPPAAPLRYPEDLLPDGWLAGHWFDFMRAAQLCSVERLAGGRVCLRPYKNLEPVGEEFSHEGSHALECAREPRALGSGVLAALEISRSISQVTRSPHVRSGATRLSPAVSESLERLGGRLFERPPHSEVVEVADGFFFLPPALRQLIFDVVWRNASGVRDPAGTEWRLRWFPVTTLTPRRAWPLLCLAETGEGAGRAEILVRLDTATPADPAVYQLSPGDDPEAVLGPSGGDPAPGVPLSGWLAELAPLG